MITCPKCGYQVKDGTKECPSCQTALTHPAVPTYRPSAQEVFENQQHNLNSAYQDPNAVYFRGNDGNFYPTERATNQMDTMLLIASIINTFCCFLVLGIIAWVYTVQARNALTAGEEQSKLKVARILNVIGIGLGALNIMVNMILYFLQGF